MIFDGSKLNPFSSTFFGKLRDLSSAVDALTMRLAKMAIGADDGGKRRPFLITGSTINASRAVWTYSLAQAKPKSSTGATDDWETLSGGITATDTAVNDLEVGNTSTVAYGYPVAWNAGASEWRLSTTPFTQNVFESVPTGKLVWAKAVIRPDGTLRWSFSAPNPITPGCEEA